MGKADDRKAGLPEVHGSRGRSRCAGQFVDRPHVPGGRRGHPRLGGRIPHGTGRSQEPVGSGAAIPGILPAVVDDGWCLQHAAITKPQTIGYELNDSPVGLAAWIVEKFSSWSGRKADVFTRDELLTNIMIYWVTHTANSSVRMYAENARAMYGTAWRTKTAGAGDHADSNNPYVERCAVTKGMGGTPGQSATIHRPEWRPFRPS